MTTHHNHLFRLSRIRGERETSDRDSSSSRPSLTPRSNHSNWTQSLTIQTGQWFQTGTKGWSVTVISNRNHTLTPPRQSLWQLFQSPDGTISNKDHQQMKKGSGSETPSQTHPSLVKICEDATRTWSEFHLHDLPRLIKVTQWKSVIFCGRDKRGSSCQSVFVWISKVVGSTFTRHSLSSHQLSSSANVKQARQILNYSENLWPPVVK